MWSIILSFLDWEKDIKEEINVDLLPAINETYSSYLDRISPNRKFIEWYEFDSLYVYTESWIKRRRLVDVVPFYIRDWDSYLYMFLTYKNLNPQDDIELCTSEPNFWATINTSSFFVSNFFLNWECYYFKYVSK